MSEPGKFQLELPVNGAILPGEMFLPPHAIGFVIFAHGSGSSRFSKRNHFVAQVLHRHMIGTLLFDLMTDEEDSVYANRFDIGILSERLIAVTKFMKKKHSLARLPFGYFGASTGAAAALHAAAELPQIIHAVVSRGGRPDLTLEILPGVTCPTLLIAGENDHETAEGNREAYEKLSCEKQLEIIKDATHLFEEPGALEVVGELAANWFMKHLVAKKNVPVQK